MDYPSIPIFILQHKKGANTEVVVSSCMSICTTQSDFQNQESNIPSNSTRKAGFFVMNRFLLPSRLTYHINVPSPPC